jgi:hypothetical protein
MSCAWLYAFALILFRQMGCQTGNNRVAYFPCKLIHCVASYLSRILSYVSDLVQFTLNIIMALYCVLTNG